MKRPRFVFGLSFLAGAILTGCAELRAPGEPVVTIDLRVLDRVPVFPLVIAEGDDVKLSLKHGATGMLREDGTIITCSHFIPRGYAHGRLCVTGPWIGYQVLDSGDGLSVKWSSWSEEAPLPVTQDWAVLQPSPPIDVAQFLSDPVFVLAGTSPPQVGETLYLVGYTLHPDSPRNRPRFARFWVPLLVVSTPESLTALGRAVASVQTASQPYPEPTANHALGSGTPSSVLRPGFSGSPVLRSLGDGRFEQCAIYHGLVQGRDDIGIVLATPDCKLPQQRAQPTPATVKDR